jgi:hypothetical protein
MTTEYELMRDDREIDAVVIGWNETRVLFDAWDIEARKWRKNLSRPILPFMLDYGLFGVAA